MIDRAARRAAGERGRLPEPWLTPSSVQVANKGTSGHNQIRQISLLTWPCRRGMKEKSEDFLGNRATTGGSWNIDRGGSFS